MKEQSTDKCDHNWLVTNLNPFTRECKICKKEEVWDIEMNNMLK